MNNFQALKQQQFEEQIQRSGRVLLPATLELGVPLAIAELRQRGGPTDYDFTRVQETGRMLAVHADNLLFKGKKKGEAAELFARLAEAIAVMAFLPGGITIFGQHYEEVQESDDI